MTKCFKIFLESSEIVMKFLLERATSDWQRFATYASLYEVNCIIENIDQEHTSNQMKMTALLEKLYDVSPLQFKELIKSTLITMKRFSVLSAIEENGCHGKEKEENKKVNEITSKEPVLINGIFLNVLFSPVSYFLIFYVIFTFSFKRMKVFKIIKRFLLISFILCEIIIINCNIIN